MTPEGLHEQLMLNADVQKENREALQAAVSAIQDIIAVSEMIERSMRTIAASIKPLCGEMKEQ